MNLMNRAAKKAGILCLICCMGILGCSAKEEPAKEEPLAEVTKQAEETPAVITEGDKPVETENREVPFLRDCVEEKMGCPAGAAVTLSEMEDEKVWEIITTHFGTVTFGNELKPDALFNYSCSVCPGTSVDMINGRELVVPVLDYSRAEKMLDKILAWNEANPDRKIKVRGHVLVWHSQTPECFFHRCFSDYHWQRSYGA